MAERAPFIDLLVRFAGALRAAGLAVGSGDVLTYCAALAPLDPTDLVDLYWAGRTTLVIRRDDIPVYDRVFAAFFLGEQKPTRDSVTIRPRSGVETDATLDIPAAEPGQERPGEQALLGLMASSVDTLRNRSFAACTPAELAALRRIMARIKLTPPRRRSRRTAPARSGRVPDLRRTAREALRMHGEPATLRWQRRRVRPRPLILILDVSGSMADYSRSLVQFAYSTRRAAAKVEVFCFGTRLTRVTTQLRTRNADDALERAGKAVFDWEGGTRIGDCLDVFVRRWGRRGMARGGIVVICSDGLDRGDPDVLATAMRRLSLLCHRIVWMNPHGSDSVGMAVAGPHIDLLLSGRDLSGCEELARLLPTLG